MESLESGASALAVAAGIGERIKQWRVDDLHKLQHELADELGVVSNAVSLWERNGKISRESLHALHETYQVSTDWLLSGTKTWQGQLWHRVNKCPAQEREHLKFALFAVVEAWEKGRCHTENSQ